MLEQCILGFLNYKPMTGYEIKGFMGNSTQHFMFASYGSIYPALRRLEKRKWIESAQKVENGRMKITYSITDEGKSEFINWLSSEWNFNNGIEGMLLHIFFGSFLPTEKIKLKFEELIQAIEKRRQDLCAIETTIPENHENSFEYATLVFGKDFYAFTENWLSEFIKKI